MVHNILKIVRKSNEKQYEIISMKDHYRIRLGIFEPDQKAKAVVQLVHGFGEYTGHYLYLINELVNAGFVCLMHDQRGHGVLAAANPKLQGRARA
ncbi:alpha/beta hydrolase [Lactococcus lactis]|nr:alpha/beta hydrolase [Lactococcus lactis]